MKIYKFGGASISNVDNIKRVASIIVNHQDEEILVVVSAMGKSTNALEMVAKAFYEHKKDEALQLFGSIKQQHIDVAKTLITNEHQLLTRQLVDFFTEVEWLLHDKPVRDFNYYYDQIVCIGEMLSSSILSAYLSKQAVNTVWLDVRDIIKTDENFRDATVDFELTSTNLSNYLSSNTSRKAETSRVVYVTQGFVGATVDNESTTLGREGSDYSAAIFANLLQAESVTIWKDVDGVMSGDPKIFDNTVLLKHLSFDEVIEMAYYGAQVIHPKTIKPLQNSHIPLVVKSYLHPSLPGTLINNQNVKSLPPIKILKNNQVLLHLKSQDFSFVGDKLMLDLYELFAKGHLKPNLIQTGAITIQLCLDDVEEKIDWFAAEASKLFDVGVERGLTLYSIRHYNDEILNEILLNKDVVLLQRTKEIVQMLYKDVY